MILCDKISDALASNFSNCQYYDFNLNQMSWFNDNNVILLHVNIRSLQKSFDSLREFIESLNYKPDIICITEARIKHQPLTNLNLTNYHFTNVSPSTNAGEVAAYISDNFQLNLSAEQSVLAGAECLWITINRTKSSSTFKQIIIRIIYRHPNADEFEFLSNLENCLTKLSSDKKDFFILGDININIFPTGRTSLATDYVNLVHSFGGIFLVTEPTRVTDKTSSLIDHIITNVTQHKLQSGIILSDISDHYPIACKIDNFPILKSQEKSSYYRDKSNFIPEDYCKDSEICLNSATSINN